VPIGTPRSIDEVVLRGATVDGGAAARIALQGTPERP
jgi:hypothetical protein